MASRTSGRSAYRRDLGLLPRFLSSFKAVASWIAMAAFLPACALSPQSVQLDPGVAVRGADVGRGRSIALSVQDRREDRSIGTRGGVYPATSTITTAADVSAAVEKAMTKALTDMGFKVARSDVPADLRMQVSVEGLSYLARGESVVNEVEVGAKVSSTVDTASEQYFSRAGITETREVLRPPAPEDNEGYINEALGRALEKLLHDPKFIEFVR